MNLATNFPGSYYSGDTAKSYDMFGYFDHQRQMQEAFANQEINRKAALEDLMYTQQVNPYRIQQERQKVDRGAADLEAALYKNKGLARDQQVRESIPIDVETKAAMAEIFSKMSDAEWKQTENGIKQMLVSPSAAERQMGQMLYGLMPEMQRQRETLASKEAIEQAKIEARQRAAEEARIARLNEITTRERLQRDRLSTSKNPRDFEEAATRYRILAEEASDQETRERFLNLSREFDISAQQLRAAAGIGKVDPGQLGGLPTREPKSNLGNEKKAGTPDNPIVLK